MNYRKNPEGYYDPTAGEAIEHIVHEERRQRKLAQSKAAQWDTHSSSRKRQIPRMEKGGVDMTGAEQLSAAIILQAVKDYRTAARRLKKHPGHPAAQAMRREVEQFFLSEWFQELSTADGAQILRQLQKEAEQ